jgi:outer membrane usher protein
MKNLRASHGHARALKYTTLALACVTALAATGWCVPAHAAAAAASGGFVEFNRSMLAGGGSNAADLTRFEHGNPVLPGLYNLDLYVNQAWVGRMDVRFAAPSPDASAAPCVTTDLMNRMGLAPAKSATAAATELKSAGACVQLGDLIPGAAFDYDQGDLRLNASIPQAYTGQMPRGYVNPESWNAGVSAFRLNYNLNTYHTTSQGQSQTSTYLGLRSGFNLGLWQLHQDSTVTWQSGASTQTRRHWQNIDTYVQRAIPKLHANLTVGDSFTDGAVFDSFGIRGVQLATNDQMLPQSLRGYAPVIRGIADTNAKVTVSQNGMQIYQATVAPGAFVINDLYPTGYGGDLVVTVTEADGRTHTFSVPYASVTQLQRAGITRFDVAMGQLRDTTLHAKPGVLDAAVQHGFNNAFTGYAGVQAASGYRAALIGGAFNTRFGAVALDVTQAHASIPGYGTHNGQSFRITYSKIIPDTDTSLTVAAYRYSTSGFLTLQNAEYAREYAKRGLDTLQYLPSNIPLINGAPDVSLLTPAQLAALNGTIFNADNLFTPTGLLQQRDRFTLTLSQRLGNNGGSLYATGSISNYWNQRGRDSQFQIGYNNHFKRLSSGVSLSREHLQLGGYDNQVFLNASLPLGTGPHAPNLSINLNHSDNNGSQEQAMLSGTAGRWNQFSYGATASHSSDSAGSAVNVNASYNNPYATLSASAGKGSGYSQESFGASGSVVAFKGGVAFGQSLGDTAAIVHVPDAAGAHIINAPNVRVDHAGYALVPYLTPYQLNTVQIDPQGLPLDVQLESTSAQVAPYQGAVVMVNFKSQAGRPLIVHIRTTDGKPAPFGAEVFSTKGEALGVVGQGGLTLLRGVAASGTLDVKWQDAQGHAQICTSSYNVPGSKASAGGYQQVPVTCRAGTGPNLGAAP